MRDVDAALVEHVARLSAKAGRPAEAHEVRAALLPLRPDEEERLRRLHEPRAKPLGPFAWADIARGVDPDIAAARELGGYYALMAERDALAAMVKTAPKRRAEEPAPRVEEKPAKREKKVPPRDARADELLGLFTYHRDAPRVAKSLGLSLEELVDELERLKIRRKAFALTRLTDFDLPMAKANPGAPSGPTVRKRKPKAPAAPKAPPKNEAAEELKKVLAAIGARRDVLTKRLGGDVLAKFKEAGLDRELAFRERDLIKGLYQKMRGSERRIAKELGTTPERLRIVIRERGLKPEIDRLVDGFRRELRNRRWPHDRIAQVLNRREYLEDLGVWDELSREVITRTKMVWQGLRERPKAIEELRKALDLTRDDVEKLRQLADLR